MNILNLIMVVLALFAAIAALNNLMFNRISKNDAQFKKVKYTGIYSKNDVFFISMIPGFNLMLTAQLMIAYGQVRIDDYKKNKKPHLGVIEVVEKIKNIYENQKEENILNSQSHLFQNQFFQEIDSVCNLIVDKKENQAVILLLKSYEMMLNQILVVLEEAEELPDEKRNEIQKECVGPLKKFTNEIQTFQEKITAFEQEVQELKYVRLKEIVKSEEKNNAGKIFDGNLEKLALVSDEYSKKLKRGK